MLLLAATEAVRADEERPLRAREGGGEARGIVEVCFPHVHSALRVVREGFRIARRRDDGCTLLEETIENETTETTRGTRDEQLRFGHGRKSGPEAAGAQRQFWYLIGA